MVTMKDDNSLFGIIFQSSIMVDIDGITRHHYEENSIFFNSLRCFLGYLHASCGRWFSQCGCSRANFTFMCSYKN